MLLPFGSTLFFYSKTRPINITLALNSIKQGEIYHGWLTRSSSIIDPVYSDMPVCLLKDSIWHRTGLTIAGLRSIVILIIEPVINGVSIILKPQKLIRIQLINQLRSINVVSIWHKNISEIEDNSHKISTPNQVLVQVIKITRHQTRISNDPNTIPNCFIAAHRYLGKVERPLMRAIVPKGTHH